MGEGNISVTPGLHLECKIKHQNVQPRVSKAFKHLAEACHCLILKLGSGMWDRPGLGLRLRQILSPSSGYQQREGGPDEGVDAMQALVTPNHPPQDGRVHHPMAWISVAGTHAVVVIITAKTKIRSLSRRCTFESRKRCKQEQWV